MIRVPVRESTRDGNVENADAAGPLRSSTRPATAGRSQSILRHGGADEAFRCLDQASNRCLRRQLPQVEQREDRLRAGDDGEIVDECSSRSRSAGARGAKAASINSSR